LAVNPRRRYDSPRRAAQARQTRAAVIDAAQQLFLRNGFAATTIAAIAARAQVSAETIYKTFGGKPGLVRAICEHALTGEGPVPAETRSDDLQMTEPDPRNIIRGWGTLTAEVAPRVSPILLLLRAAAATDPEMAGLRAELDASRLRRTEVPIHPAEPELRRKSRLVDATDFRGQRAVEGNEHAGARLLGRGERFGECRQCACAGGTP